MKKGKDNKREREFGIVPVAAKRCWREAISDNYLISANLQVTETGKVPLNRAQIQRGDKVSRVNT